MKHPTIPAEAYHVYDRLTTAVLAEAERKFHPERYAPAEAPPSNAAAFNDCCLNCGKTREEITHWVQEMWGFRLQDYRRRRPCERSENRLHKWA